MTEQPHETLHRAADVLEERAGKATQGSWRSSDTYLDHGGYAATVLAGRGEDMQQVAWLPTMNHLPCGSEKNVFDNAEWVVTMSPAVAAPLVAWLRTDAERCRIDMVMCSSPKNALAFTEDRYAGALAFARMVLGEAT